jgi:hypothetical protein
MMISLPGGSGSSADDRAFYEFHREALLAEPWSRPGDPAEGFWLFEPGIPAHLRGSYDFLLDSDREALEAAREAWIRRKWESKCRD